METLVGQYKDLVEHICRYSRLCYDRGLVGAAGGNLSVRIGSENRFIVTASGVALRDITPGNLIVVDETGKVLEGNPNLKPSKETGFHLAVYRSKPSVRAVVHVHPPYSIAFASAGIAIPLATVSAELKLKQAPIVSRARPGSRELCDNVARAAKEFPQENGILLLAEHGAIAFHQSLCDAFDNAELAEDTARIALLAAQLERLSGAFAPAGQIVDLTAPLNAHTRTYPTDPPFRKSWHVQIKDAGACVSKLEFGAHTGTHVDAPLHYLEGADSVAAMSPATFFGKALAIAAPKKPGENITPDDFVNADIREGDIVLFRTGWEERSGSPQFFQDEWPGFTPEAIGLLIRKKVKAIGGDIASADSPKAIAAGAPAHKKALQAGIPIFEALVNMREIVGRRFFFIGLPLKIENCEASPIRATAILA